MAQALVLLGEDLARVHQMADLHQLSSRQRQTAGEQHTFSRSVAVVYLVSSVFQFLCRNL